jgi:CRISPR-associated endoribonuclease Cas6
MRIRLTLLPKCKDTAILPLNHYPFQAVIYHALSEIAPDYSRALHEQGYGRADSFKRFRLFVFSRCYLPDPQIRERAYVRDGHLLFNPGHIEWQIASPIPDFIRALIAGLAIKQTITVGDQYASLDLEIAKIEIIEPPRFKQSMLFYTLSPITVSISEQTADGTLRKHYVRAGDEKFGPLVRVNLLEKYRALTGVDPDDSRLQFEFDENYIRKRGGVDRISKLVQFKETKIKSYQAPFRVRGSLELIQLGWECGFGNANSQGFGMVE